MAILYTLWAVATRRDQRLTWMYGENIYKLLQLFHEESTQYSHHRGQIAIVSSVASFLGMPWAPAYCATKAARIIRKGLERNKPRITFPWPMAVAVWMATIMPPSLMDPLMRQLPKKV